MKLIEVALPLEAINKESAREKSIRHGHPSTLHLWWARRPLAACRAVLFAQLVDDPASHPDQFPTEEAQEKERQRLFRIIEDLVKWENITNETVLNAARTEILKSTGGNPPPVYDPFCGGGSIPLEAQRLGLEAHGSDLNPVAVLITKALIEIPPKFAGQPPINPKASTSLLKGGTWKGAQGLAEDVRYYGHWMRDEAEKRIGHLYPKATLPGGGEATVIAWLWARTVKCPNPACGAQMPLVRSFALSTKKGKETWVEPVVTPGSSGNPPAIAFEVKTGKGTPPEPPKLKRGANFKCIACNMPTEGDYIKAEGMAGRMGSQLMAIVAEGKNGRAYLSPTTFQETIAQEAKPSWRPEQELANDPRNIWCIPYGLTTFGDLFTSRQLVALTTFSDLVSEAREKSLIDGEDSGLSAEQARAYADAVATYLGLAVSRLANRSATICFWDTGGEKIQQVFARQAIPMTWDYTEGNPFSDSTGNFVGQLDYLLSTLELLGTQTKGNCDQLDATSQIKSNRHFCFSTDPPYYDAIAYADLSDFFYIWLRRCLRTVFPDLFGTLTTPKAKELVAIPYRFDGSKQKAQQFFEGGLYKVFEQMRKFQDSEFPLTVYYAFKQTEAEQNENEKNQKEDIASTGWETMLEGLITAGFSVNGTWPMRTELTTNLKKNINALATSVVLVCRPRPETASIVTRREFLNALKRELPDALKKLQHGNIAPVDLAQASIGPGMGVYSRAKKVIEADGSAMTVRTALQLINRALDEYLSEQEGELDNDTRFAVTWYENYGFNAASYGDAETLAKARNVSVSGVVEAGILHSAAGKVRLLKRSELQPDYDPLKDERFTVWEAMQYLIKHIEEHGEQSAAEFLKKLGPVGEQARALAYRLYSSCERRGWAEEAGAYNSLVIAWPELERLATQLTTTTSQPSLFGVL